MSTPAKRSQNWLPGIFNDFFGNEWIAKSNASAPALNIVETEKEYIVEIAAPGVTKDDFCVTVDKHDQLIVTVENRNNNEERDKKGKFLRREFSYSQFQQTLILPENVNKDDIRATQDNGVLTITIPKNHATVAAEPKRIAVE
ncbi:MAG: Hsp20/alpha crystallin family protein [Bacteroidaceae bacterium]|nr:Hsp20/alpha crystallin family protein [Bacteroidaceae bacterium]